MQDNCEKLSTEVKMIHNAVLQKCVLTISDEILRGEGAKNLYQVNYCEIFKNFQRLKKFKNFLK